MTGRPFSRLERNKPSKKPKNLTVQKACRIIAILLAATVALAVAAFFLFRHPGKLTGAADDFNDVKLEQIIAFAERSNSAYHEEKDFRHEYGLDVEHGEFPVSGLRVYVDRNPTGEAQWIILRGTANWQNIFDDLDFVGRDEHELGINVHAGFDQSLQECLPWILERIDKTRPVRVTGHSLGGSVAALLVATLDHGGFRNVSAITFGKPKFTDAHGAGKLARLNVLRIVHAEDPIPMLPPIEIEGKSFAIYHHFGPEVIVKSSGHFLYLPEHSADRLDVSQLWATLKNIRPMSHDMVKGYLPALKSAMKHPHSPLQTTTVRQL
jgi:triacylglycerol lipase